MTAFERFTMGCLALVSALTFLRQPHSPEGWRMAMDVFMALVLGGCALKLMWSGSLSGDES